MMHLQFDRTKKAVAILWHCPCGAQSSLCAAVERESWKYRS